MTIHLGFDEAGQEGMEMMHGSHIMLTFFESANLSTEVRHSEKFPISTVFVMISAVSHLNSKLRFTLFEMFHLRKLQQNHKKRNMFNYCSV